MKLGVPVIARNNPSNAAIIRHQSTGLLYTLAEVRNVANSHYLYLLTYLLLSFCTTRAMWMSALLIITHDDRVSRRE